MVDGSQALRAAIEAVCGRQYPVQRCRSQKVDNVLGYPPDPLDNQVEAAMKAAYRLPAEEGVQRLKAQARWLPP